MDRNLGKSVAFTQSYSYASHLPIVISVEVNYKNFHFDISVAVPFVQHFIFALKRVVLLLGSNPVEWLRKQLTEVINIRKNMGVRDRFQS